MATKIEPTELKLNSVGSLRETDVTQQTIDSDGSDFYFEPTKDTRFLLYIRCDHGSKTIAEVKVEAGDYFQNEILGNDNDLEDTTEIGLDEAVLIGPLESARFKDENGRVNFEVTGTGTTADSSARIEVFELSYEG